MLFLYKTYDKYIVLNKAFLMILTKTTLRLNL